MRTFTNNPDNAPECNFGSTLNKGYFMNVNGFRISVQYGPGNYVGADIRYSRQPALQGDFKSNGPATNGMGVSVFQSNLAEVMIDTPVGMPNFQMSLGDDDIQGQMGHNDTVFGHCTSECVAKMIGCIASTPTGEDTRAALVQIYQSNR